MIEDEGADFRRLFTDALERSGLSRNEAARRADISGTRWGQIVAGYELRAGHEIPSPGPPATVARMARAVDISPAQLRKAGRADAAAHLERMLQSDIGDLLLRDASEAQILAELTRRQAERDGTSG